MEALVLFAAALTYVGWVRRWPWQDCQWCGGKGRYTRETLILRRRVHRDCTHCTSGLRRRLGAGRKK